MSRRSSVDELREHVRQNLAITQAQSQGLVNGVRTELPVCTPTPTPTPSSATGSHEEEDNEADWGIEGHEDFDFFNALVSRGKHSRQKTANFNFSTRGTSTSMSLVSPIKVAPPPPASTPTNMANRRPTRIFFKRAGSYGDPELEQQQALAVVQKIQQMQHTAGQEGKELDLEDLDDEWETEEDILSPRKSEPNTDNNNSTVNNSQITSPTPPSNPALSLRPVPTPLVLSASNPPTPSNTPSTPHVLPLTPTRVFPHSTGSLPSISEMMPMSPTMKGIVVNDNFWDTQIPDRRSTVMDPQKHPRSFSIDRDAKVMGLNTQYLQRLALPLLRTEIYNFFVGIHTRYQNVAHALQTDPVKSYSALLEAMKRNATETNSESLQKDFVENIKRVESQLEDIKSVAAKWHESQLNTSIPTYTSNPSGYVSPRQQTNTNNIPIPMSPTTSSINSAPQYPPNFAQMPLGTAIRAALVFVRNRLNQICRYRDLMKTFRQGFEISANHDVRLEALPTTNSNVEGLRVLTMAVQALDCLVDSEGGKKKEAARISLCFQRLANTLLERHNKEEERWKIGYQGE